MNDLSSRTSRTSRNARNARNATTSRTLCAARTTRSTRSPLGSQPILSTVRHQRGASLVEFSIIALSVVLVGLFTLQLGLLYHAKTTLNYAVFEAARAGAVNNAKMSAIREELGIRLAPLQGGDGTRNSALAAIARSTLYLNDPINTRIAILNPTPAAFRDWAVRDQGSGQRFIPVNHLRHQSYDIGAHSGLSLRDATLLKLQVTHGVDLRVPVVGKLMTGAMRWIDIGNAVYYLRDKWPIQSVATVRMQSDALEAEILSSANASGEPDLLGGNISDGNNDGSDITTADGSESGLAGHSGDDLAGVESGATIDDVNNADNGENQGVGPVGNEEPAEEEVAASAPDTLSHCDDDALLARQASPRSDTHQMLSTGEFRLLLAAAPVLD